MTPEELGLPHRPPFVFVDRMVELVQGQRAVCEKTFAPTESFFGGHFPGDPLVPGVILTEALAQTAGIAVGSPGAVFHLSAIKLMKFVRPVRPDERLTLSAEKTLEMGPMWQFSVTASVGEEKAAEGVVILNKVQ